MLQLTCRGLGCKFSTLEQKRAGLPELLRPTRQRQTCRTISRPYVRVLLGHLNHKRTLPPRTLPRQSVTRVLKEIGLFVGNGPNCPLSMNFNAFRFPPNSPTLRRMFEKDSPPPALWRGRFTMERLLFYQHEPCMHPHRDCY